MAAVNVPTNLKIKEKDVNQKLQLFGIYTGRRFSIANDLAFVTTRTSHLSQMMAHHCDGNADLFR